VFRRILTALVVGLAVLGAGVAVPGTAVADPGFCGVRVGVFQGVDLSIIYTVHNKCSRPLPARVYLPDVRRYATPDCEVIPPAGYGSFHDLYAEGEWAVQNC
jgi:hypothetical protein